MQTCFTPNNRRILCRIQCFPICMICISHMHCQFEPISIGTICHIGNCLRQHLQLICFCNVGICIVFDRLPILRSLGIFVQQDIVLSADGSSCSRRTRNMCHGLIQEFPHIYLRILIGTETNIMHQIIHIHLDGVILYLFVVDIGIIVVGETSRQHGIQISIRGKGL